MVFAWGFILPTIYKKGYNKRGDLVLIVYEQLMNMIIRKDTYEVFYINFSLVEKLQKNRTKFSATHYNLNS